jgi:hypothetical protein
MLQEPDYPFDLGDYARETSTESPVAQAWFDRGLVWSYAFEIRSPCFCRVQPSTPGG